MEREKHKRRFSDMASLVIVFILLHNFLKIVKEFESQGKLRGLSHNAFIFNFFLYAFFEVTSIHVVGQLRFDLYQGHR